jgi:hypothetical protein
MLNDLLPPARLYVFLPNVAVVQVDILVLRQEGLQLQVLQMLHLKNQIFSKFRIIWHSSCLIFCVTFCPNLPALLHSFREQNADRFLKIHIHNPPSL